LQIKHVHGSGNARCVGRRLRRLSLQPHVGQVHSEAERRKKEDSQNQHKKNGGLSRFSIGNLTTGALFLTLFRHGDSSI
jgi:hypothetical protein